MAEYARCETCGGDRLDQSRLGLRKVHSKGRPMIFVESCQGGMDMIYFLLLQPFSEFSGSVEIITVPGVRGGRREPFARLQLSKCPVTYDDASPELFASGRGIRGTKREQEHAHRRPPTLQV
jgi:hypothetical protein